MTETISMIGKRTLAGERIGVIVQGPWQGARGEYVRVRFQDGSEANMRVEQLRLIEQPPVPTYISDALGRVTIPEE